MKTEHILAGLLSILIITLLVDIYMMGKSRKTAYPVSCADIPESNEKIIIVRDGLVECHYKITKVRERK